MEVYPVTRLRQPGMAIHRAIGALAKIEKPGMLEFSRAAHPVRMINARGALQEILVAQV